ncbi:hypothetical protein HWV01_14485 [Moritella sp. 5]|uniref:STY4851/ECs_5259 family protein n=1 Tax=Moritella sp. 5 TaxID=2746231 RepID=UPI001BAABFF0|nr:STY4851/ECs_5259 family protein [Moritella sp. 5]QUM81406.1 hypothetical protein HWV01_14485 [Moritella sp. 5]
MISNLNVSADTYTLNPQQWLTSFLARRALLKPNYEPLFSYQLSQDEYISLKNCIVSTEKLAQFNRNQLSTYWCGAFTLFCAEWFRREYTNAWSWEPIWKELGFELLPTEVRNFVSTGLETYWKRSVIQFENSNNNFLGSVFSEGGLPLKLLIDSNNNFQLVFQNILKRYSSALLLGHSINELVGQCIEPLPEAFKVETSINLIADMAEKLIRLASSFELEKQDDPSTYLDNKSPHWRSQFPLPLNEKEGADFLNGLLRVATNEAKLPKYANSALACTHLLSIANQVIKTQVHLPNNIKFNITKQQLSTTRVELAIFEGDTQIAHLGTLYSQFDGEMVTLRIPRSGMEIKRHTVSSELHLVVMQLGQTLDRKLLPVSALDIGESPIGFIEKDGEWHYAGQASFSTKANELLVILPADSKCELENSQAEYLNEKYQLLDIVKFSGSLKVSTLEGGNYVIKSSSSFDSSNFLTLVGNTVLWPSKPSLVFTGLPLYKCSDTELNTHLKDLYLCIGKRKASELLPFEQLGRHSVSLKNTNNETVLLKRIGILPADFKIDIVAGSRPNEGMLKVSTKSNCQSSVITPNVEVQMDKLGTCNEISLKVEGTPPAFITLSVLVSSMSDPILLDVPFPAKGCIAFNASGEPLSKKASIDDLLGSRLYLFTEQGRSVRYKVELTLKLSGSFNSAPPCYQWDYFAADKPIEINLYSLKDRIEQLMSLSPQLDCIVELKITGNERPLIINIQKYTTKLDFNSTQNTVGLFSESIVQRNNIEPLLMRIAEPDRKLTYLQSKETEGVNTGEFALPDYIDAGGPWLVVPSKDSNVNFRAKFILGGAEQLESTESVKTLQKAVVAYHPRFNPNAIADVVALMAADAGHSGWLFMQKLYSNYGHLPLATFEVWSEITRNSKALCLAVLRFESDPAFILRLENEFPILWEFVLVNDWLAAKSSLMSMYTKMGLPLQVVTRQCNKFVEQVCEQIPAYSNEYLVYLTTGKMPAPYPAAFMQHVVQNEWYQSLLHKHSHGSEWPNQLGNKLQSWFMNYADFPIDIKTHNNFHNSVVYFPVFAAAVAAGVVDAESVFNAGPQAVFQLRLQRDFDREWFESLYCYALFQFLNKSI